MLDFWIFSVLFLLQRCSHLLGVDTWVATTSSSLLPGGDHLLLVHLVRPWWVPSRGRPGPSYCICQCNQYIETAVLFIVPGYSFTLSQSYLNIVNDSLSYQWSFGNLTDVTLVDEDGYSMQVDDLYYGDVVVDSFDKFNQMRQLLPAVDNFNQLPKSLTAFTSCRHPCLTYHLNLSYQTKLKKPNLPDRIDHSWTLNSPRTENFEK